MTGVLTKGDDTKREREKEGGETGQEAVNANKGQKLEEAGGTLPGHPQRAWPCQHLGLGTSGLPETVRGYILMF